ncbi:MAG: hypothetical protein HYR56_24550 [Acidobacteria bacterium]|nr:hypothetical protein [Acidobacteriota bacterium]MBI3423739.1 hypothetical protein [Acidobacteriota bacterium]
MTARPVTEPIDHQCHACATGVRKRDKYCRHCGAQQLNRYATVTELIHLAESETKPLDVQTGAFQTYSGQLLKVVTESLAAKTAAPNSSRSFQRLLCTLITLPLWMLIVLLSPLDAYAAARTAAGYVR